MKGKIVRWVDDRGFGFINTPDIKGDIFVHVSKFRKGYRRPQVGDDVEFLLDSKAPKLSVLKAKLIGVEEQGNGLVLSTALALAVLIVSTFALYLFVIKPKLNPPNYENMGFSCKGKVYCSQMTSCDEAKFYLAKCPNVKIDGDRDGIPCESQHCN
ncbi:cold shock domain-containing protein [Vibrio fluvialis]|nr:cold-shock protein [Vibrio fluvialis]ELH7949229.1 cold shock domain-containing protein [Vibrio fluvialis]EMC0408071.1 cold shock domain-containing protein [Vibrio fluvialis]MBY8127226.1 cold shock domain-containing protein [Vibrio fluvialis]